MAKRKLNLYAILGAVAGTGLTALGIRRFIQWYQAKQSGQPYGMNRDAWRAGMGYQSSQAIPATGVAPAPAPPATGTTAAERVNSDQVRDFDERGTAFTTSELSERESERLRGEASEATGRLTGTNVHGDDAETPDRRSMDTAGLYGTGARTESTRDTEMRDTGTRDAGMGVRPEETGETTAGMEAGMRGRSEQQASMDQTMPTRKSDIVMDEVVAPLIEHAIAFHSVMNLLRSRQREGMGHEGTESLTEGDRNSMRAVLDQMQQHTANYDEATLRKNSLAMRSNRMTTRLRDALNNLTYSGTDLFRIYDEIRPELCTLARELDNSGQVTITGMDHIRQLYEC